MLSIKENVDNEIIIKKSKFITFLIKINDESEVITQLDDLKKRYVGASHYCYAFICGNVKRFNDDGEPGGTAGVPILNVLESNNLNNILCVVIRYFGGIKLGAGGLIRAYRKSVVNCLKEALIITLVDGFKINIKFKYDQTNKIDHLLKSGQIINKSFDELVHYTFLISTLKYNEIYNELTLNTDTITKIENILIEI